MQATRTESFSLAGAAVAGTLTGVALLAPALWTVGLAAAASGFWAASAINHARGKKATRRVLQASTPPVEASGLVSPEEWNEWRVREIDDEEPAREPVSLRGRLSAPRTPVSVAHLAGHFAMGLLDQRGFVDVLTTREDESVLDVSCVGYLTPRVSQQIMDFARSKNLIPADPNLARSAGRGDLPSRLKLVRPVIIGFAADSEKNISLATLLQFILAIERAGGVVAELSWSVNRAHSQFMSEGHMQFGFRDLASADRFAPGMLLWQREFAKQNWSLRIKT